MKRQKHPLALRKKTLAIVASIGKAFKAHAWWETAIFCIGVVTILTVIVMLFLPIAKGPQKVSLIGKVPPVSSSEFVPTLSATLTLPVETTDTIEILNNGDAFMESLLSSIDAAHSSINFMAYIWEDGEMSDEILSHMEKKLDEGIPVRIAIDGFGGKFASMKRFKDAGGEVYNFHSFSPLPWDIAEYHKRNHRRAIVIDGSTAYIGGIGVEDKWLGNAENEDQWRDTMFKVTGRFASNVQGSFVDLWAGSGELLTGEAYFPEVPDEADMVYVPLASSPTSDTESIEKFIELSLASAEEKIYITTPYFLASPTVMNILEEKAKSGVEVQILLPNKLTDTPSVRYASRYLYDDLLKAGVHIYEYQPTFIHAKYMTIDGIWSVIGSANLDNRSMQLNQENIFGVRDAGFANDIESLFSVDASRATEITKEYWDSRGLGERMREVFARKFVQQY